VTTESRAACVIGWPVEHSRSPLIHNYWLKQYGIAGEYRRELVPREEIAAFVRSLAARGYVGANVTVPHKEAALALSEPEERARAVGAVNTLWLDGDVLRSTNTDVEGFLDNLDVCAPHWHRDAGKAVVLGAGGAARAVIYGLLTRGVERIVAVNRTPSRAEMLRQAFGGRVHVAHWDEVGADLGDASLLVNSTTLGMQGQPYLTVDLARLPGHAVVADLVYVPVVTPLLAAAKARSLRTADGLGMLLHQAVRGFALWFGKKPAVTAQLRALVEADLGVADKLDAPDKKDSR
jgi:shikimate dehydrogenase